MMVPAAPPGAGSGSASPQKHRPGRSSGTAPSASAAAAAVAVKPHDAAPGSTKHRGGAVRSRRTSARRNWIADIGVAPGSDSSGSCSGGTLRWRRFFQGMVPVLRAHPGIWVVSLLATLALLAASVVGVALAAQAEVSNRLLVAQGFAENTAVGFESQLQQLMAPLLALSVLVRENPDVPHLDQRFGDFAQDLLSALPSSDARLLSLQLSPQGVVRLMYPLKGNEAAIGLDQLRDPTRRPAALETIARDSLTLQGPMMLKQGYLGLIPRLPIFIPNVTDPQETFGAPAPAYNCSSCYNATTRTRFWGFASCIISFEAVSRGSTHGGAQPRPLNVASSTGTMLGELQRRGYNFRMVAPQPGGGTIVIAETPAPPLAPVSATLRAVSSLWTLQVAPARGWVPSWRQPLLAMVVIVSVAMGLMLTGLLVNVHQQAWLLRELRVANSALASEKERMDVLLARQYNLISVLLEQGGGKTSGGGGAGPSGGGSGGPRGGGGGGRLLSALAMDTPDTALERIEGMRREIGVASASSATDQLQLLDAIGEGAYGKVYKGLWRGTVVAIKTMILPAKMSGAEKHERMAIMEAAISSAIQHPNIVQTYTYTIKPQTSSHAIRSNPRSKGTDGVLSGSSPPSSDNAFNGDPHTINFEVSLVLEYCEMGSLRDALDMRAFHSDGGAPNYAAVLDTAADVARAMAHLHAQNVLHSDLKPRNVLLRSDGGDGRGVVAKVADFGLAVKMEAHATHVSEFQGTPSHMAPEAQLQGRLSKAGDVYSFGICLWELYTGEHAFAGMPMALLGHHVAVRGERPVFPAGAPPEYADLARSCWAEVADDRPTFEEVLSALVAMRDRLGGKTAPLRKYTHPGLAAAEQQRQQQQGQPADGQQQQQQQQQQGQQQLQQQWSVTGGSSSNGMDPASSGGGWLAAGLAPHYPGGPLPYHHRQPYGPHHPHVHPHAAFDGPRHIGEGDSASGRGFVLDLAHLGPGVHYPLVEEPEATDTEEEEEEGEYRGGGPADEERPPLPPLSTSATSGMSAASAAAAAQLEAVAAAGGGTRDEEEDERGEQTPLPSP